MPISAMRLGYAKQETRRSLLVQNRLERERAHNLDASKAVESLKLPVAGDQITGFRRHGSRKHQIVFRMRRHPGYRDRDHNPVSRISERLKHRPAHVRLDPLQ